MKLKLDEVKEWIRVDIADDDDLIKGLMTAAESYIHNATGKKTFGKNTELAKLLCYYLIGDWYDNRDFYNPTPMATRKLTIDTILTQLRYGDD